MLRPTNPFSTQWPTITLNPIQSPRLIYVKERNSQRMLVVRGIAKVKGNNQSFVRNDLADI